MAGAASYDEGEERVRELERAARDALADLWRMQDWFLANAPEGFMPPTAVLNSYFGAVNSLRAVLGSPVKPGSAP